MSTYSSPGALPIVELSSIKRDLYRRDFTINTLAVSLDPGTFGKLIDFFGGSRDIKEKTIRVLHNLAFVEDPTRILRAIRFSSRFGFALAKHTLSLLKTACRMKFFDKVEGKRLLNEFIYILNERNPLPALSLMAAYGIPQAVHPALNFNNKSLELSEAVSGVLSWWKYQALKDKIDSWVVYLLALTDPLTDDELHSVMERLSVLPALIRRLIHDRTLLRYVLSLMARNMLVQPSEITDKLRGLSMESLLFMMAKTGRDESRMAISRHINSYRHVKPILTGRDLLEMGYKPGPVFREILATLRNERLNGLISSLEDERAFVCRRFPLKGTNDSSRVVAGG